MYVLTATDINALKRANDLCIHLDSRRPTGQVRLIKRKNSDKPFDQDVEHELPIPVFCRTYDHRDISHPQCFAMISFYRRTSITTEATIIDSLRVGDEVAFVFVPDGYSNQNTADASLHVDVLEVHVKRTRGRKVQHLRYALTMSVNPENSARMCQGVPFPRMLERQPA